MSDKDSEVVVMEGVGRSGEKDRKKAGRKQKPKPNDGYEKVCI
ncbi:hypothetical protein CAEBREN_31743 [Caenorhabditis brenneri]|uniref:Uncharacterized protein n=1 Tax=Caenorhabditis brenneri TaxID=135651 RepID=G0PI36_CAEBE|nr:hypothetical protein CAEBREN_31743 [Caenorhabditis brenneri]